MSKRLIITVPKDCDVTKEQLNNYIESIDKRFAFGMPLFIPMPLSYEVFDIDDVKCVLNTTKLN